MKLYVCKDCAELDNGKWPFGHIAKPVDQLCDLCGDKHHVYHAKDWDWPKGHRLYNTWRMRED